jgi:uncharacterized membrane protein YidH (DUF202 family)
MGPGGPGLARERTVLAWNRSGLALVVCIGVLVRHLWPLEGAGEFVALGGIAAAVIVWSVGMMAYSTSGGALDGGLVGERVFRLMTVGTLLLALVGFVLAFFAPT